MESTDAIPSRIEGRSSRELVEKAEDLALADLDEPLHITGLCRALGVSERTLRKAFHKVRGVPPCRHLRMMRLSLARWTLLSADCNLVSVTDVATCFGFMELGRFSVEYRKVFGESPSQTLHRDFAAEARPITTEAFRPQDMLGLGPEPGVAGRPLPSVVAIRQRSDAKLWPQADSA
ncbi:helix-turn-helix domain-containing protein [Bradyrhizobium australiense]|uniref:Helix-turn-helix domain-containing protein n=1 Tax=Bradyrhizobium australiense TaxID=2721161 RepID=A0A7Y4GQR7_9BRAD|nr:helix-turn-helix domain-containing protein [Bradyrhizobium australiense]